MLDNIKVILTSVAGLTFLNLTEGILGIVIAIMTIDYLYHKKKLLKRKSKENNDV